MTHEYYSGLKSIDFGPTNPFPLPELGTVSRKSRVQVTYMFKSFGDLTIRYSKLQFTDPATREQLTAYGVWEDVSPKLKEVQ